MSDVLEENGALEYEVDDECDDGHKLYPDTGSALANSPFQLFASKRPNFPMQPMTTPSLMKILLNQAEKVQTAQNPCLSPKQTSLECPTFSRSLSNSSSLPDVVVDSMTSTVENIMEGTAFKNTNCACKHAQTVDTKALDTVAESSATPDKEEFWDHRKYVEAEGVKLKVRSLSTEGQQKKQKYRDRSSGYWSKDSTEDTEIRDDVFDNAGDTVVSSSDVSLDSLGAKGRPSIDKLLRPIMQVDTACQYSEPGMDTNTEYEELRNKLLERSIRELFDSPMDVNEIQKRVEELDHTSMTDALGFGIESCQETVPMPPVQERSNSGQDVTESDEECLLGISRAARCQQWGGQCDDESCTQKGRLVKNIEKSLYKGKLRRKGRRALGLRAIWNHSRWCDELNCTIPWCSYFSDCEEDTFDESIDNLLTRYRWELDQPYLTTCRHDDRYVKLSDYIIGEERQKEGIDWKPLVRIGMFGKSVLALATKITGVDTKRSPIMYWLLKKYRIYADMEAQHEAVLARLKNCCCCGIAHHLWYLNQGQYLIICTELQGESLEDILEKTGAKSKQIQAHIWQFLQQLMDAAVFLKKRNIVYLNWTAKSIVLKVDNQDLQVLLADFMCALALDLGDIEDSLFSASHLIPVAILPPELLQEDDQLTVSFKSDTWGLVALIYQLYTGHMIREELRHETADKARTYMKKNQDVCLDEIMDMRLNKLLQIGFMVNPDQRGSVEDLQKEFHMVTS